MNSKFFRKIQCLLVGLFGTALLFAGIYKYFGDSQVLIGKLREYNCQSSSKYRSSYNHELVLKGKGTFYSINPVSCEQVVAIVMLDNDIRLDVRNNEFLSAVQNGKELFSSDVLKSDDTVSFLSLFGLGIFISFLSIRMWPQK